MKAQNLGQAPWKRKKDRLTTPTSRRGLALGPVTVASKSSASGHLPSPLPSEAELASKAPLGQVAEPGPELRKLRARDQPGYDVGVLDLVIRDGLFFDGTGAPAQQLDLGLREGRVAALAPKLEAGPGTEVVDAAGAWVMPGFIDTHTHYDAELLAAPSLAESVRHGVTTVTVGSCSISTMLCEPEDATDLFSRVEAIPREFVLPLLRQHKQWSSPRAYVDFLDQHGLGPNVTAFLGHSELRAHVMGLERSIDRRVRPSEAELSQMEALLEEGLDVGLLGLSTMTTKWDKLDGARFRSSPLPSTFARQREYNRLNAILRRRGRIHQGTPDIVTKVNVISFLLQSIGLLRRPLKTTLITLMDVKSNRVLHKLVAKLAHACNRLLNADFRWQALPCPFEVHSDGLDLVIFEEFGAGQAALHLKERADRDRLISDPSYRAWFKRDYATRFSPRVWHRDFYDTRILDCPDAQVVGQSIGEVADDRGLHPVEAFLDLVLEHGPSLRWKTVIGNDRRRELERIVSEPATVLSFSDAGAHLRNMAFYNYGLQMLKLVRDAELRREPFMSIERAVWRLTGELADWFDIDAGRLAMGDRADVTVIDPNGLNDELYAYDEADMEGLGSLRRMVKRNDRAVRATVINGRVAYRAGRFAEDFGQVRGYGRFLRAGAGRAPVPAPRSTPSKAGTAAA